MIPSQWPRVFVGEHFNTQSKETIKTVRLEFGRSAEPLSNTKALTADQANVLISNLKEALLEVQK